MATTDNKSNDRLFLRLKVRAWARESTQERLDEAWRLHGPAVDTARYAGRGHEHDRSELPLLRPGRALPK